MKKRYVFFGLLESSLFFLALKIIYDFFKFKSDETILFEIKSRDVFFENWLIYSGSLLILASIIGMIFILYNPCIENKKNKNLKFEDLCSSIERK